MIPQSSLACETVFFIILKLFQVSHYTQQCAVERSSMIFNTHKKIENNEPTERDSHFSLLIDLLCDLLVRLTHRANRAI